MGVEQNRKPPGRAGGFDAVIGGALGEVEHLRAVGKERRAALAQIEPSRIDFDQAPQQIHGRHAFAPCEAFNFIEKLIVGERFELECRGRHVCL
jgi:hypothetical protein